MKIGLIVIYLILTISGLIFMKLGGNPGAFTFKENTLGFTINLVSLVGFICYIGSFFLFTRLIVMFDLSYIFPICTGIVQVISLIASGIIFKEEIGVKGVVGASVIIIGIIIMNLPKTTNITT